MQRTERTPRGQYRVRVVTVTPELAKEWLEAIPVHQRRIKAHHVAKLARALEDGTLDQSPQPIIRDWDGNTMDGQHRLGAVLETGISLESVVVVENVDPDLFDRVDIGLRRTPAQFIAERHASLIAAAARLCIVYKRNPQMVNVHMDLQAIPLAEVVREAEQREALASLAIGAAMVGRAAHINAPILLAVTAMGWEQHRQDVGDWLEGLNYGADLSIGDPRLTLRNVFATSYRSLNSSVQRRRAWVYVVKSWNAWVLGESLRFLKWQDRPDRTGRTEVYPTIL